jgi:hypothetical protein
VQFKFCQCFCPHAHEWYTVISRVQICKFQSYVFLQCSFSAKLYATALPLPAFLNPSFFVNHRQNNQNDRNHKFIKRTVYTYTYNNCFSPQNDSKCFRCRKNSYNKTGMSTLCANGNNKTITAGLAYIKELASIMICQQRCTNSS